MPWYGSGISDAHQTFKVRGLNVVATAAALLNQGSVVFWKTGAASAKAGIVSPMRGRANDRMQ